MVDLLNPQYENTAFLTHNGHFGKIVKVDLNSSDAYCIETIVSRCHGLSFREEGYTRKGWYYLNPMPAARNELDIAQLLPKSFKFFIW